MEPQQENKQETKQEENKEDKLAAKLAKKEAKLLQMKEARESALRKRKAEKEELQNLRTKISQQPKEEPEEEPPKKKQRITKEDDTKESLSTSLTRGAGVLLLGIGTWYLNNVYGKKNVPAIPAPDIKAETKAPVPRVQNQVKTAQVGPHGFRI